MTTLTQYQAIFPSDGFAYTRRSKRPYTHAWRLAGIGKKSGTAQVVRGFATSQIRAQHAIGREMSWLRDTLQEIVPVTIIASSPRAGSRTPGPVPDFLQDWTFTAHNDRFHGWTHPAGAITVQGDPTKAGKSWAAFFQAADGKCTWLNSIRTGDRRKFATAEACARAAVVFWLGNGPSEVTK